MPLTVKLNKEISGGVWSATGNIINSQGQGGPAEVLLETTGKNKMKLILDSNLMKSMMMNEEVLVYKNAGEVDVKKIAEGAEVKISNFWFTLKK